MDNADLSGCLREHAAYRFRKAVKVVGTGNQDILHATGLQIGQYTHPKGGALRFADPHSKYLLVPSPVKADSQIYGLVYHLVAVSDLEHDPVHPDYQILALQRTVLPFYGRLGHLVCYDGYGGTGQVYLIDITHFLLYVGDAHTLGIQGYDQLLQRESAMCVAGNCQRLEGTVAVSGNRDFVFAVDRLDGLGITSVAGVAAVVSGWIVLLVSQVNIHLALNKTLVKPGVKVVHELLYIFFRVKLFQKFIIEDTFWERVLAG